MRHLVYRFRHNRLARAAKARDLPASVRRYFTSPWAGTGLPADRARFVVFDTEMTGLGKDDRLLSIGAVRVVNSRLDLGDRLHEILNPHRMIPAETILVHNIMPDMAAECPDSSVIVPQFLDFIGPDILVAHNGRFDREFINREMLACYGLPLASPIIDVMLLSRVNSHLRTKYGIQGALERHSLDALASAYGIRMEDRHSALGDALATGLVFLRLLKALQRFGLYTVRHLLNAGGI